MKCEGIGNRCHICDKRKGCLILRGNKWETADIRAERQQARSKSRRQSVDRPTEKAITDWEDRQSTVRWRN